MGLTALDDEAAIISPQDLGYAVFSNDNKNYGAGNTDGY